MCRTMGTIFRNMHNYGYNFWEIIAKLLGGRFSINKLNVQLEIKVCNIEILRYCNIGKGHAKFV